MYYEKSICVIKILFLGCCAILLNISQEYFSLLENKFEVQEIVPQKREGFFDQLPVIEIAIKDQLKTPGEEALIARGPKDHLLPLGLTIKINVWAYQVIASSMLNHNRNSEMVDETTHLAYDKRKLVQTIF